MIALQRCGACRAWQYPERDACRACLSDALEPEPHPGGGLVLASAIVRRSLNPAWAGRLPRWIVTVLVDDGPHLIAFGDAKPGARVQVRSRDGLFDAEEIAA